MPIRSKVFIQTLLKSQDRHNISFSFEIDIKNTKKVFTPPSPNTIKVDLPPNTIRVKCLLFELGFQNILINHHIKAPRPVSLVQ